MRPWHQIRETAKLEHVRIHDLRHIFATKALDAGVSLDDIAPLLGHKSTAMTRTYAHRNIEALREATDNAGKLLAAPDDRAGAWSSVAGEIQKIDGDEIWKKSNG